VAMFPPVPEAMIERGYQDFADRWNPILDVFDAEGVRFAHEVHPSEIAYDYWTTRRAMEAVDHRPAFGLNFDPSHFVWQDLDPVGFLYDFRDRIYHVDCKEARKRLDGRNGRLGSHLPWGDPRRGWDFVSAGHGDIPWEDAFRALDAVSYAGPISIEWEDSGMDRMHGAPAALAHVRSLLWKRPAAAFDSVFAEGPGTAVGDGRVRLDRHDLSLEVLDMLTGRLAERFAPERRSCSPHRTRSRYAASTDRIGRLVRLRWWGESEWSTPMSQVPESRRSRIAG
jgi:Xylose isomerase-like TIM barrel